MAACQLASKGKTLDDPSYESELSGVRAFLTMQSKHDDTVGNSILWSMLFFLVMILLQTAVSVGDFW
jgi:hypothetical protein